MVAVPSEAERVLGVARREPEGLRILTVRRVAGFPEPVLSVVGAGPQEAMREGCGMEPARSAALRSEAEASGGAAADFGGAWEAATAEEAEVLAGTVAVVDFVGEAASTEAEGGIGRFVPSRPGRITLSGKTAFVPFFPLRCFPDQGEGGIF